MSVRNALIRHSPPARERDSILTPVHLAAALLQEAEERGEAADRRDMPFGIPVDHIPIVKAGIPALTIMRGTLQSLRRVHRPDDSLDHLRGDGVVRTVDLVCGALERLRAQSRTLER